MNKIDLFKYHILAISVLFLVGCTAIEEDINGKMLDTDDFSSATHDGSMNNPNQNNQVQEISTISESIDNEIDTYDEDESINVFSRDEIAIHNSLESCWVGYNGYVYDLTPFLSRHPGGADAIIPNCGTIEEFTESYNNQHGEKTELRRNDAIGSFI